MSNYPPGVTGNEYQIAGPDWEGDALRECPAEGVSVRTITLFGVHRIEEAITQINGSNGSDGNFLVAVSLLRSALGDIELAETEMPCPFAGDVTITRYQNIESWECPLCRVIHETEVD